MQIENNKEEVPFSFYEERFRAMDPAEAVARLGEIWDGKEFYVNLMGKGYAIAWPEYGIRQVREGTDSSALPRNDTVLTAGAIPGAPRSVENTQMGVRVCPPALPVQTFMLRYLLEGKALAWNGTWKTFREMPWGELYIKPYTGRVLTRAAFTFGTRIAAFKAACEKMGAEMVNHGDAGYEFTLIGGYKMQILVWEGDEEFPPNAQVLYSDNFEDGFAPEDRVVAGDILITAIKGNM